MRLKTLSLLSLSLALVQLSEIVAEEVNFNQDVRPILSNHCFHCHGPDAAERKADLRLDTADWLRADSGNPEELLRRVKSKVESEVMPPSDSHDSLMETEVRTLEAWIEEGAAWTPHWSYIDPKKHPTPNVNHEAWTRNFIDFYILEKIEQQQLKPSKDADIVTLVRRLSFDLTGLPPQGIFQLKISQLQDASEAEIETQIEQIVDRLLSSAEFGERMAVYWLDLVRYADTVGYHGDQDQNIWPYRDWVIRAFNENMPFDQFTIEQLAGDLLQDPTQEQIIATGYNRLLQTSHEGGVQAKEYRAIYAADRVRNLSAVWMAATVGCAQCHDHKYDPYTIRDFYALSAFFADIDDEKHFKNGSNALPTRRDPELELPSEEQARCRQEIQAQLNTTKLALSKVEKGDQQYKTNESQLKSLEQELRSLEKTIPRTMITVALQQPRDVRVLPRGDWLDESGDIVQPSVPAFLVRESFEGSNSRRQSRLDLAKWLVDPQDGAGLLTARIMVNRLWFLLFGEGLARNLDDFGAQGEPPTHSALLDRLAHHLIENNWDLKATIKLIATSRTYRQSSANSMELLEKDPDNRLFAKQNAYRLPAEMIRDNLLAVSGLLNKHIGGPSVKPYQPAGYYRHLNFPTRKYQAHQDDRQWRRGLYVHWQRQFLHPMLKAFDAPSREECTAQRDRSNTPLAALTLLNDPSFVEGSRALANSAIEGSGTDEERIVWLWNSVLSRNPGDREIEIVAKLLSTTRTTLAADQDEHNHAFEELVWATTCRAVLNLAETTMRR